MEELERLKGRIQAVEMTIAKVVSDDILIINQNTIPFLQEMSIHDLRIEFENLESTRSVDFTRAATVTSYNDWLDIKSVGAYKRLPNPFIPDQAQDETPDPEKRSAFRDYYWQGEPGKSDHRTGLMQIRQI